MVSTARLGGWEPVLGVGEQASVYQQTEHWSGFLVCQEYAFPGLPIATAAIAIMWCDQCRLAQNVNIRAIT